MDNVDDALHEQAKAREQADVVAKGHELRAIFDIGLQVHQFLDSDLGRRLLHDATAQRKELTEKFVLMDMDNPEDARKMRDIRFRINVLNCWQEFFEAYIKEGEAAEQQLLQLDYTD